MFKSVLAGTIIATGLAFASPAHADQSNFGIYFGNGYSNPSFGVRFNNHRRWVSPRKIRRIVRRHYGCYDISRVKRFHRRYSVKATCGNGERVKMIFSARSGRLLREVFLGYENNNRQDRRDRRHRRHRRHRG